MEQTTITDIAIVRRAPRWPVRLDPGRTTVTAEGCPRHLTLNNS
jgi:hypothetical protein